MSSNKIGGVRLVETERELRIRVKILIHVHGCFPMSKLPSIRRPIIHHKILPIVQVLGYLHHLIKTCTPIKW